ncbi:MAG TPA: ABC transporter permease subunit [Thermomicrobiales bacterium]|nr:ABC transporter permease subunit [Thermomicrobiales bacterium]
MTMLRITARLLRRGLGGTLMLFLGIALFEFINPVIGDSLGGAEVVQGLFDQLPPGMRAIAQVQPDFFIEAGFAGFISLGFTHPVYFVLVSSSVVGFSARSIAGEVDSGVIALTLARPVSRRVAYLARVAGLLALSLGLALVGVLGSWIGTVIVDLPAGTGLRDYGALFAASALLAWAVGGMVLGVSAASSTTGRVVGWATAVLVVLYFIDYFAELWSVLETLGPFSVFRYFDPAIALVEGRVPWINVLVLGGAGTVAIVIGLLVFERRDLPV